MFDPRLELYAITDQASARGRSDEDVARELIAGGATCLQYRAKKVSAKDQWATAFRLREITRAAGTLFFVNDRVDLALDCEADGVHLGQDDTPTAAARRLAGKKLLIGRSTHSLQEARDTAAEAPDYIAFGPVFATQTKENNVPALGLEALQAALRGARLPVVAIGGIKPGHLEGLARAGAEHVSIVTALTGAEDVAKTTRETLAAWRAARQGAQRGIGNA